MSEDLISKLPQNDSDKLTLILANMAKLQEGVVALGTDIRTLRVDVLDHSSQLYNALLDIQVQHRDLHHRLTRLELGNNPPNSQT